MFTDSDQTGLVLFHVVDRLRGVKSGPDRQLWEAETIYNYFTKGHCQILHFTLQRQR